MIMSEQQFIIKKEDLSKMLDEVMNNENIEKEIYNVTREDITRFFLQNTKEIDEGYVFTKSFMEKFDEELRIVIVDNTLAHLVKQEKVNMLVNKDGEIVFSRKVKGNEDED